MSFVMVALLLVAAVGLIVFTIRRNKAIRENGIEADAVVSRIEENEDLDSDGGGVSYTYYVQYQTQDGQVIEARLGNVPKNIAVGSRLRIKYLPDKPKYVLSAS
ncbi:MAG: DUF3592 domain-containing protein [Ruminococcaceae bacterium]|nr:DUF3592 domain-containing protein [Oscillospiraceae bacterium]